MVNSINILFGKYQSTQDRQKKWCSIDLLNLDTYYRIKLRLTPYDELRCSQE